MSKKIVSGAFALVMLMIPVSASALMQDEPLQVQPNPSIEDLLHELDTLTVIAAALVADEQTPQPDTRVSNVSFVGVPVPDDPSSTGTVAGVSISFDDPMAPEPNSLENGTCTYAGSRDAQDHTVVSIAGVESSASCSSWCSTQALQSNLGYACTYNGTKISMVAREAQVASVLTAMQDVVVRIMAWFKPGAAPAPQPVATTSTTATVPTAQVAPRPTTTQPSAPSGYPYYTPGASNVPTTVATPPPPKPAALPGVSAPATPIAPAPKPAVSGPDNILRATFKGAALPPVPAATKQLAQALCRADATCVWNNETITAVAAFGQPGDPTITFVKPEPGKGEALSVGAGYTFEFRDGSLASGSVPANTYRVYLATYSAPGSPDKIYQASVGGVERTASGSVQIAWFSRIENADGSTAPIPPGTYYAGAVNIKNGLKGGTTGALTIK